MREHTVIMVLPLALTMSGCAPQVTYTALNPPPRPLSRQAPASVPIYSSAPPDRPHVDVGLLEVTGREVETTESLVLALRTQAAQRGCDALVLAPPSVKSPVDGGRSLSGTCVMYTGPRL